MLQFYVKDRKSSVTKLNRYWVMAYKSRICQKR